MPHVKVTIDSIRRTQLEKFKDKATLILKEDNSERYLPILISSSQADILTGELQGLPFEQRTAPGIFLKSVNATCSDIICITVHLAEDTFYTKVLIYQEEPKDVKCPIGVAMALAYRTQGLILVSTDIMNKWAVALNGESTRGASNSIIETTDVINSIAREVLHF